MTPIVTRRTFVGLAISSACLITSRPTEAPAALATPDFIDEDKRRILDYVFGLIDSNFDGAAAAYGEVLKRDARSQRALVGLGRTQHAQGNRAAAIATLEQAVSIDEATSDALEARALLAEIR